MVYLNRKIDVKSILVDPIIELKPLSLIPVALSSPLPNGNSHITNKQPNNRVITNSLSQMGY